MFEGKVLTKVALELSCMDLCSPDWGAHGANEYWRTLLDRYVGRSTRDWGCPVGRSYQGAFAHPPTALLHVPPQSGSPTWGKGAVAASSTLQRVLPREVTHVRPKSDIPLLWADDTWGRVPSHILINLRILGPRGREPGQRPCPAGTPTWVGFQ